MYGNLSGGLLPRRTPPGSAYVRVGPIKYAAESAKFILLAEYKSPPRNPPWTRRTPAEQICSAADPIGSAADWRNFRRGKQRKKSARVRYRESPRESAATFAEVRLPRNYSAADTAPRTYSANFELPRTYSANFELPRTYSANAPI